MKRTRPCSVPAGRDAGFVVIAVLVIAGLIAVLAATWAHHVLAARHSALATPSFVEAREAAHSAAEYARQALLNGQPVASTYIGEDGSTTHLSVSAPGSNQREILVQTSRPDGMGSVKLIAANLTPDPTSTPAGPDDLPHLPPATIAALLADGTLPRTDHTADTVLTGADLGGLHVVHDGVVLRLGDVVLQGAIVSAATLSAASFGPFDPAAAPTLLIDGNLRIDSQPFLHGVAILMPNGSVATGGLPGTVQIHGDVVACAITIARSGALRGRVQAVAPAVLGPGLQLVGSGRKPLPWAPGLEYGESWDPSSVAVVPSYVAIFELADIVGYWSDGQ